MVRSRPMNWLKVSNAPGTSSVVTADGRRARLTTGITDI